MENLVRSAREFIVKVKVERKWVSKVVLCSVMASVN